MALVQLPVIGGTTAPPQPLRKIAIEEHFMPPENTGPDSRMDLDAFAKQNGIDVEYFKVVMQRMGDLHNKRVEEMDEAGIDISILSLNATGIEGIADPAEQKKQAVRINDFLAEQVQRSRGRFRGFASVPLLDPDATVSELTRAVRELGFHGVMVNGYVQDADPAVGHYLDEERFLPFWETVAELGVPVYLHPRTSVPPVQKALYAGHQQLVGATWGFAPETATHALRLVYSGLFDRFPQVNLILGHLGETIPYFAWRIQKYVDYSPLGHRVRKRLQDYLSDNFYLTISGNYSDQALICALLTIGADRIIFATDYPFGMSDEAARWLENVAISEGDRRKIAHGNAKALFKL